MDNKIDDLFHKCVWYPNMIKLLDDGMTPGTVYDFVTSDYLDGYIPYVKPYKAFLLKSYRFINESITDEEIQEWESNIHTKFSKLGDDVVFIGTTNKFVWFFYLDQDCSDCTVGRLEQSLWSIEALEEAVKNTYEIRHEIVKEKLTNWISFY